MMEGFGIGVATMVAVDAIALLSWSMWKQYRARMIELERVQQRRTLFEKYSIPMEDIANEFLTCGICGKLVASSDGFHVDQHSFVNLEGETVDCPPLRA